MTTNMEIDMETSLISMLPEEVLFDVFGYLKTCDRKNAKLVCKSWFRILSRPRFTRFEKLFLPEFYDLATITKAIDNWSHDKMNLKFVERHFMQNSELFWKRCGPKINSLYFDFYFYLPDMISEIFEHCVNLEEFDNAASGYIDKPIARRFFGKSGTNHLSRPKLLKLDLGFLPVSPSDLKNIASVFPNLKTLNFEVSEYAECCFPTIQNLIKIGQMARIEKLHVHFTNHNFDFPNALRSAQEFISSNRTVRVTVSVDINPDLFTENNIRQITSCKFLTWLSLTSWDYEEPTDMTLLARFINETPMLKKLQFTLFLTTIDNFCIIWSALVNSRLTYIHIQGPTRTDATFSIGSGSILEIDSSLVGLRSNNTVHILDFTETGADDFSLLTSKYFRGVYNLSLCVADPTAIFLYQKQLQVIKLIIVNPLDITLSPTSIESIEFIDVDGLYAVDLFSFYRFPNLKYLSFGLRKYNVITTTLQEENVIDHTIRDLFNANLQKLASILLVESPKLTRLQITSDFGETLEPLFQFCRDFHNLQHIYLRSYYVEECNETDLMQEISKHVDQWCSLKALWVVTKDFRFSYFFNAVTGEYEFYHRTHGYCPSVHDIYDPFCGASD